MTDRREEAAALAGAGLMLIVRAQGLLSDGGDLVSVPRERLQRGGEAIRASLAALTGRCCRGCGCTDHDGGWASLHVCMRCHEQADG